MKVSIITAVYNNKEFIEDCIRSVLNQTYKDIEHIIIDGGSTDGTLEVIKKYDNKISKIVSEPDNGIYDAMNKGIKLATGDLIGILNSDDMYASTDVIKNVVDEIQDKNADCCWGDLVYVDRFDANKIVRYWKSTSYKKGKFRTGWMPPHPTFFVRREVYKKFGNFNVKFRISADYEIMLRFLEKYRIESCYIPQVVVEMRTGGNSRPSLFNTLRANIECYNAWRINGLKITPFIIFSKPLSKIQQYIKR